MSDETKVYDIDGEEMDQAAQEVAMAEAGVTEANGDESESTRRGRFKPALIYGRDGYRYVSGAECFAYMKGPFPSLDAFIGKSIRNKGGETKQEAISAVIFLFDEENFAKPDKIMAADAVALRLEHGPWFQSENSGIIASVAMLCLTHGFPTILDPLIVNVGPVCDGGPVTVTVPMNGPTAG